MKNANLWLFTEELADTPKRELIDEAKESSCWKQGADFIREIGGSLKALRRVINTAIVSMNRALTDVYRNDLCIAALFLSAKMKPFSLEHIIKTAHSFT
ncbi:hypothetical protein TNIN_494281 [Trichonephila inaurata madagascariensis]|uniref:Uncharacterized protein n=1 Tax=Trichonephila inaurata madagascariensis TaxID=2747483 RepID=A0A8X6YL36_9ARAC|nr:hypothetical protein TNIN_494281 [Trichonephila inaurata madagascariensis]